MRIFIVIVCMLWLGGLTAYLGFSIYSWEFWAIIIPSGIMGGTK